MRKLRKVYIFLAVAIALFGDRMRSLLVRKRTFWNMFVSFHQVIQRGTSMNLLDCPLCGLPSEISVVLYVVNLEDDSLEANYVMDCLADHKSIVITAEDLFALSLEQASQ